MSQRECKKNLHTSLLQLTVFFVRVEFKTMKKQVQGSHPPPCTCLVRTASCPKTASDTHIHQTWIHVTRRLMRGPSPPRTTHRLDQKPAWRQACKLHQWVPDSTTAQLLALLKSKQQHMMLPLTTLHTTHLMLRIRTACTYLLHKVKKTSHAMLRNRITPTVLREAPPLPPPRREKEISFSQD